MPDYSEKELLILSNYLYFNCSVRDGTIGDTIDCLKDSNGQFNVEKLYEQGAICANMSQEEAVDILTRIDGDERLRGLTVSKTLNEHDIRGVCFTDSKSGKSCVVFRGTGGTYDAWYDNVSGEYESDTVLQKTAAHFVSDVCGEYKDITVSGHSKGGNLAQYVTVVCGDRISRCVSFDGQGFGKDFIKKYSNEIAESKDKITSVAAYNDYVNILLTSIAGTSMFLKNEGKLIDGHSSGTLLRSITFNDDGSINEAESRVMQGLTAWMMKKSLSDMVDIIDILPADGRKKASDIVGTALASFMSNDKGEEYEKTQFLTAVKAFGSYAANMLALVSVEIEKVNINTFNNSFSAESMKNVVNILMECASRICFIYEKVGEIKNGVDYTITGRYYTDKALDSVMDKLLMNGERIKKQCEILNTIYLIYIRDEDDIAGMISKACQASS